MRWFDDLQRTQLAKMDSINPGIAAVVRQHDAIYLYGTIGSEAVLLRDGQVRIWSADDWPASEEYTERMATASERIASLVLGARKYAQLRELLPARPDDAPACTRCRGVGFLLGPDGVVCPDCSGLGWRERAI